MHRYGLLLHNRLVEFQKSFDVISLPWDNVEKWPTQKPVLVSDKKGQKQYVYPGVVFFKIVQDLNWSNQHTAIVEQCVADWNEQNPSRIIQGLPLVYTRSEMMKLGTIFDAERKRLIEV